jgi:hypothetical protein
MLFTAALILALFPRTASSQGQWMDIGSGATYTIADELDPLSFERFPPFAFGGYGPENFVYAELVSWPCSGLPSTDVCNQGRFVAAFNAFLDTGTCPCSGVLFEPIQIELHYDPAVVRAVGAREEDLRIKLHDSEFGWVDIDDQRVDPGRDVVIGTQGGHARQFYAILVEETGGDRSTWGQIKAQWTN